ncbi:Acyl-coenzyme A thioesterase 9, mitochondrial [Tetrabaena socialis]|uniref:Acyl-coenzyme A thioesterase 9, mitochondrial n=1 Tax=Tetrabaena socialis TaxID=47790 RepID=A0A2J8A1B1_9CHLO|nr:Acyl-coenzyme A thioesterase 9, mitochondrial [Tetrabaena socialis]|eukprot:PNH06307.1 Acyl-coenzyme A thioesterase 9, mitochondrial [Tetrabaena socialis]
MLLLRCLAASASTGAASLARGVTRLPAAATAAAAAAPPALKPEPPAVQQLLWRRHYTSSRPSAAGADAGAAGSAGEEEAQLFIGGYTPITKKLWVQRRNTAKQGSSAPAPPAIVDGSRPPRAVSVVYNFTTDRALQDMYRNPWGSMRVGRLLEDLDSLAGNVAFEHCYTGAALPLLVTAAVDEISLRHPLRLERDIVVRGQVVWTGKSALDIRMQLFQEQHGPDPSVEALFSFVHLDPTTRKAAPAVQLRPETAADAEVFRQRQAVADARRAARQQQQQGSCGDVQAVPLEARDAMSGWVRAARRLQELPALAPTDAVLMPKTCQHNTFVCQPQHRNTHGRVFGGFLMRRAYELAFATSYMFGGARPVFQLVDEITFSRPVDVGDLLRLTSTVVHAKQLDERRGRVVVEVEARVTKPEAVESFVTNTFTFVYNLESPPGAPPLRIKSVLPTCDEEALRRWRSQPL